jgi:predicted permease
MALAGTSGRGFGSAALEVAQRILLHPFIIATAAGVLAAALQVQLPVALDRLMEFLQNAAAPCALFALGVTVALRPLRHVPWEVPMVIAVKLLLHPAIVLALLSALGPLPPAWVYTAVLMAALPPALNVFIIARQYGVWVPQASGSVLLGTLVSVVTLTTTMWLVKAGRLPHSLWP